MRAARLGGAGPAKAWLAREEMALHEVLAAVLAMKEKGFVVVGPFFGGANLNG